VRFLMTVNGGGTPPDKELFAEMGRFVEELSRAGVLLATGGLDAGTHVTSSGRGHLVHRRAVHRGEGGDRQLRAARGPVQGRGDRAGQAVLEDRR
jgi:hypothetical protein